MSDPLRQTLLDALELLEAMRPVRNFEDQDPTWKAAWACARAQAKQAAAEWVEANKEQDK